MNHKLCSIDLSEEIYQNARHSVCGINLNDNHYETGTGFFCQIPDPKKQNETMIALLTYNHVLPINEDNLQNFKYINYQLYNGESESLCLVDGRRIWVDKEINDNGPKSYENLDYACREIFPKYKEELGIFKIDEQTLNNQNPNTFGKLEIKSYTFIEKKIIESNGKVTSLEIKRNNSFNHNLKTEEGYSGSPLIHFLSSSFLSRDIYNKCIIPF